MTPCFEGDCLIKPDCMLIGVASEALWAFMAVLDGYTVADLVRPRVALAALLRVDLPA